MQATKTGPFNPQSDFFSLYAASALHGLPFWLVIIVVGVR